MTKRRSFSDKFKATVTLEALRGDRTTHEIAAKHKIHPTQLTTWKRQAVDGWCQSPSPSMTRYSAQTD